MKKLFLVFLVFAVLLCTVSCGNFGDDATRGYIEFPESNSGEGNSSGETLALYYTFEKMCKASTNVVIATYNGTNKIDFDNTDFSKPNENKYKKWSFTVQESLFGSTDDVINVYMRPITVYTGSSQVGGIYFDASNVYMEKGHTYLLCLNKHSSVYNINGDYYTWSCGATVDLDALSESTMYNQGIQKHAENINFDTCTKDELIAYVRELVKDNKPAAEIFKSDDLEEIVKDAENVVRIKINDPLSKKNTVLMNVEKWSCEVTETLKGGIEEGSSIDILFIGDVVIPGKEYIVMLGNANKTYSLTTVNSLRPISEKREIKGYID